MFQSICVAFKKPSVAFKGHVWLKANSVVVCKAVLHLYEAGRFLKMKCLDCLLCLLAFLLPRLFACLLCFACSTQRARFADCFVVLCFLSVFHSFILSFLLTRWLACLYACVLLCAKTNAYVCVELVCTFRLGTKLLADIIATMRMLTKPQF